MDMQANASLAPNSWDQYVSAIIEYYNVTSGSTQLSNSTAAPGETWDLGANTASSASLTSKHHCAACW